MLSSFTSPLEPSTDCISCHRRCMSHRSEPLSRTGPFANRCTSASVSTPPSTVACMARPLSAPRSNARKWPATLYSLRRLRVLDRRHLLPSAAPRRFQHGIGHVVGSQAVAERRRRTLPCRGRFTEIRELVNEGVLVTNL